MKPKIAQFIDTDGVGGAEVILLELSAALQAQGAEVIIVHFDNKKLCRRAAELGIKSLVAPGKRFYKKTYGLPIFCLQFSRFLKRENFDLLHSHLFGPICASAPAARLIGIPALGTLHDVYLVKEKPVRRYLLKLAALCKMQLVSVSRDMQNFYHSLKPAIASTVIYNGADTKHFEPNSSLAKGNAAPQLVTVGRLVALKRIDLLIQAVALIPNAQLTVVGDGPERTILETLANNLLLKQRIRFVGEQNDVLPFLQQSSLFCLTSSTEGLSRSIIEAMSCGLAIVATDVGGNRELVTDGTNGYLLEHNCSAEQIATAIEKLFGDSQRLTTFALASRARAEEAFSLEAMVKSYQEAYLKLLR